MRLVDKEFGGVVLKGKRGVDFLCKDSGRLLLEDSGKFFVLIGGEEVRWLVQGGTRR